jgi:hypothetical protein
MFLKNIIWNGLYSSKPFKQAFAGEMVYRHVRKNPELSKNGVETAFVTYVPACPFRPWPLN